MIEILSAAVIVVSCIVLAVASYRAGKSAGESWQKEAQSREILDDLRIAMEVRNAVSSGSLTADLERLRNKHILPDEQLLPAGRTDSEARITAGSDSKQD